MVYSSDMISTNPKMHMTGPLSTLVTTANALLSSQNSVGSRFGIGPMCAPFSLGRPKVDSPMWPLCVHQPLSHTHLLTHYVQAMGINISIISFYFIGHSFVKIFTSSFYLLRKQLLNQTWGQFSFRIGIDYLKKNGIGIDQFWIGIRIEVSYTKN